MPESTNNVDGGCQLVIYSVINKQNKNKTQPYSSKKHINKLIKKKILYSFKFKSVC